MKKMLKPVAMAMLACAMLVAPARSLAQEEYNFAGHEMSVSDIVKEWHNQNLYSAGSVLSKMTIKNYFVGLAYAYPNYLLHAGVDYLLGLDTENIFDGMVLDEKNGYFKAEVFTELVNKVEMCYWRTDDGGVKQKYVVIFSIIDGWMKVVATATMPSTRYCQARTSTTVLQCVSTT